MMRTRLAAILMAMTLSHAHITAQSAATSVRKERMKILVHVTQGPENPTRAALAFLVAKTAIDEGDAVTLFLAGDAEAPRLVRRHRERRRPILPVWHVEQRARNQRERSQREASRIVHVLKASRTRARCVV
jgi:hypothetical protein